MTYAKPNASSLLDRSAPSKNRKQYTKPRSKHWEGTQIRRARRIALPPLLQARGYRLRRMPNDNYLLEDHGDLVVKEHYWNWPSRGLRGNAIDFLVFIECRSFDEAMEILTEHQT